MRQKIRYKKYKRDYHGLLVIGIWLFVLFSFLNNTYIRCIAYCPIDIQYTLDGLRILLFITSIFILIIWFLVKHDIDNWTLIELEGDVIEPNKWHNQTKKREFT